LSDKIGGTLNQIVRNVGGFFGQDWGVDDSNYLQYKAGGGMLELYQKRLQDPNLTPERRAAIQRLIQQELHPGAAAAPTGDNAYTPLLNLIGNAEGTDKGRGYNETYAYGRWTGSRNLTGMTLSEIQALQKDMIAQQAAQGLDKDHRSSALGRYQINLGTLRDLMQQLGLTGSELFTPELQDRLAAQLIKTRGGTQNGLASIWASLPRSDTELSWYAGIGQNASVSSAQVQNALAQARQMPTVGAQATARGAATTNNNQSEVNIG